MSRILAVWIMVFGIIGMAYADVITNFDTPQSLQPQATSMKQMSVKIIPSQSRIVAEVYWIDGTGNVLTTRTCDFTDATITNGTITAGKVGQKYVDVIMQFVQTKCKTLWGVTGTDTTQ